MGQGISTAMDYVKKLDNDRKICSVIDIIRRMRRISGIAKPVKSFFLKGGLMQPANDDIPLA